MTEATATPQPPLADVDDFLAWVEGQRERYEFVGGRVTLMAGGSEAHKTRRFPWRRSSSRCRSRKSTTASRCRRRTPPPLQPADRRGCEP